MAWHGCHGPNATLVAVAARGLLDQCNVAKFVVGYRPVDAQVPNLIIAECLSDGVDRTARETCGVQQIDQVCTGAGQKDGREFGVERLAMSQSIFVQDEARIGQPPVY